MKRILLAVGRLLLGGAFAYAAAGKLLDPAAFAADIGHYRLLPHPLTLALAVYLPWLELACAAAVLVRRWERGALVLLLSLCLVFGAVLASAWWRGLDISCGCFGAAATKTPLALALLRVLGLAVISLLLLRHQSGNPKLPTS